MEYLVIIEKAEPNGAAYSPDVPGCVATGNTPEETLQEYTGVSGSFADAPKRFGGRWITFIRTFRKSAIHKYIKVS